MKTMSGRGERLLVSCSSFMNVSECSGILGFVKMGFLLKADENMSTSDRIFADFSIFKNISHIFQQALSLMITG